MDEQTRQMVLREIILERDELLLSRQKVRQAMARYEMEDRLLERALADRTAAARVFGHNVGYPADPRDYETIEKLTATMTKLRGGELWTPGQVTTLIPAAEIKKKELAFSNHSQSELSLEPSGDRPRIRDRILEHLKSLGREGAKAAEMRAYLEAAHGTKTHEKTVGMTLYRLSQEGLVRRQGRTWFFVPPEAETKNPGGSAPGSIEARSNERR